MKPQPTPKRPAGGRKMPKARIMYAHPAEFDNPDSGILTLALSRKQVPHETVPVLVIQPSLASARRRLKWERMSGEEKVQAAARALARSAFKCAMDEWVPGGAMDRPRKPRAEDIRWYARHCRAILTLTGDLP